MPGRLFSMKAIKLVMAVMVIGLVSISSSVGEDDEIGSPFGEELSFWSGDLDFDFDFGYDLNLGDGFVWGNAGIYDAPSVGEDHCADDEQDAPSDWDYPVDDWIIDEGFYSDFGGSMGEEPGWSETDDHPGIPGPEENALWIVFPYSTNVKTTKLVLQKDRFAKELLIPGMDGKLTIYELKPDNTLLTYVPDWQVKAKRAYRAWFTADAPGDYAVWYEVYNAKANVTTTSNVIEYRVFENLAVVVLNEAKCPGETATLRAIASGCSDAAYQWYKGRSSKTGEGEIIDGETKSAYVIRNVSPDDAGYYTCNVTCNGESDEDSGRFYVGWWECDGISPCKCQFRAVS